jgi:hypothetical protein
MKLLNLPFDFPIGKRHAFMLAQIFCPIFNEKTFDKPAGNCGVLENTPTNGPVPAPDAP